MDLESGEVIVQTKLKPKSRGRGRYGDENKNHGFVMVWPHAHAELRLSGAQYEAFDKLISWMEPGTNIVMFYTSMLAASLGLQDRSPAARLVRQLVARGAIRKIQGEPSTYFVNPNVAWNGDSKLRLGAILHWDNRIDPTSAIAEEESA